MSQQVLSWVLGLGGAYGMWLAGRKSWHGWAVGLALQPFWLLFAVKAHAWGLIVSPLLYGSVYARNLLRWRRTPPDSPVVSAVQAGAITVNEARALVDVPPFYSGEAAA